MLGTHKLLRIFIGGSDTYDGQPLFKAIVELCLENKIAGATVQRCMYGYGRSAVIHSSRTIALSENLPLIVEVVDSEANLNKIIPEIKEMLDGGLITMENIEVLEYK
ncbi:protein of unknown function DUF190 [Denitrovibrio acetiphilus DSM 12809]|uniref:Uncharacterized protein n=1 Tax=Denitrovibrio acetiphilus (strain DSM 12809 / NBRC 114555 / N2460) TaxID=522772 RepID=D4H0T4_DENA2|nr:DUF190 domain-containing protein [Denitrovibrio acetiphilus]ADD68597.1 protein of unknown function DUF190 [Denitrovibrio acetiphilus DSM 12809]